MGIIKIISLCAPIQGRDKVWNLVKKTKLFQGLIKGQILDLVRFLVMMKEGDQRIGIQSRRIK